MYRVLRVKTANCSHFGMGKKIKIHCFREPIATLFRVTVVLLNGSSPKIHFILFITVVGIKRVVSEVLGITVGRTVRYDQNEDGKLVIKLSTRYILQNRCHRLIGVLANPLTEFKRCPKNFIRDPII